jgi:hypothetical protein
MTSVPPAAEPKVTRVPWKERSEVVAYHLTKAQKEEYKQHLNRLGMTGEEAFTAWLRSLRLSTFLSETQMKYLDARAHANALSARIGKRKMRLFGLKWRMLGGKPDGSNHDEMFGLMLDALLDKVKGVSMTDLILFKQFCASYFETAQLDAEVRRCASVKTSPPPSP